MAALDRELVNGVRRSHDHGIATVRQEKEISEITQLLADIFRYSTSGSELATIDEEVRQLERYLHITKYRYGDDLRWQVIVDPSLRGRHIVKLLLQPVVENAVIHGIGNSGTVKIIVLPEADHIAITVADNGAGMTEEEVSDLMLRLEEANLTRIFTHGFTTKKTGHGFGLHSAALAAKELHGSLAPSSMGKGHGATFTLTLPCAPAAVPAERS